jgi:hypothetical protein
VHEPVRSRTPHRPSGSERCPRANRPHAAGVHGTVASPGGCGVLIGPGKSTEMVPCAPDVMGIHIKMWAEPSTDPNVPGLIATVVQSNVSYARPGNREQFTLEPGNILHVTGVHGDPTALDADRALLQRQFRYSHPPRGVRHLTWLAGCRGTALVAPRTVPAWSHRDGAVPVRVSPDLRDCRFGTSAGGHRVAVGWVPRASRIS